MSRHLGLCASAAFETLEKANTALVENLSTRSGSKPLMRSRRQILVTRVCPMGCDPMGHILYDELMRYNPKNPYWFDRHWFVLSAGHGCMLHYAVLHLADYDSVKISYD